MRHGILVGTLLAALLVIPADSSRAGGEQALRVGRPFPNLVLPSAENGRPMSLEQFRGTKVLLHIFASW